jgi:tetratricopeptide (TPR) repeat protein
MQAQMTGQPMPTSRKTPVRTSLMILFLLALIGLGIYAYYNAGWFDNSANRARDLFATATTSIGQFFSKAGNVTGPYPPAVAVVHDATNPSDVVAGAVPQPSPAQTLDRDAGGNIPPAAAPTPSVEERLNMARSAFAAGDIDAAVEGYRMLIASNPDNVAALGELGNIFYAVGMTQAAAQAYFDVASAAIDQNRFDVAENLLPAIIEGNPMLAAQLNDRMFAVHARNNSGQPGQPAPGMYQPYQQPMPPFMQPGGQY